MKKQSVQLKLQRPVLLEQSDGNRNLWELVSDLRNGTLHIPFHQREFVWPQEKQDGWIERLASDVRPVGVIVTYQVSSGTDRKTYVNDGNQRLGSLLRAVLHPELYGLTLEYLEELLRSIQMPVQHRIYRSHVQAFEDYQGLNWGTPLTPYQFHKGALTTLPEYETVWEPVIQMIHGVMPAVESSIVSERGHRNGKQASSVARDDLGTFYRFISKSASRDDLHVARQGKRKQPVFEWALRKQLEDVGPIKSAQEIRRYRGVIEQETELVRHVWHNVLGKPIGTGVNLVTYRWMMCAAVWRRNANVSVEIWQEFLIGALRESGGRGRFDVIDDGGIAKPVAWLAYNDLTKLDDICKFIGSRMVEGSRLKQPKRDVTIRAGNDASHRLPFSSNGHSETLPEPASLNRARGARPMTSEEVLALKATS